MPPGHSFGLDLSTLREGAYSKTLMRQFKRHFARFREKRIHMKVQVVAVRGSQFYPQTPETPCSGAEKNSWPPVIVYIKTVLLQGLQGSES